MSRNVPLLCAAALFWIFGTSMAILQPVGNIAVANVEIEEKVTDNSSFFELFVFILGNNILAAAIILVGGLVTGGFLSVAGLLWNGFILGVIVRAALMRGMDCSTLAFSLVLHGPVEFAGFVWVGAMGLRGTTFVLNLVRTGKLRSDLLPSTKELVVPLILIGVAAGLEALSISMMLVDGSYAT